MKKIFIGEEQTKDTFICTLVKLFGIEKYEEMEKFCSEIELSFCVLNDRNVSDKEYFEFLNNIKFDLMEEIRNKDGMNIESQVDAMDMDDNQKETFSNISDLIEEANTIEPYDSKEFCNPVFNTNFYVIYLLVLILNNHIDGARYLYRRLPKPILNNRTIKFINQFLSFILKKDIGSAISILNKEIENENERLGKNIEKEEDIIEEEVIENIDKPVSLKSGKQTSENEADDEEKMDIYISDKEKNETNIIANTPEQSSGTNKDAEPLAQVDTPEETMKEIDYDKEEDNGEDNDDDGDDEDDDDDDSDDDDDDDDNDENNDINLNINENSSKVDSDHLAANNTMTPVETQTPLSTADIPVIATTSTNTKRTFFKIKRCSLFILQLLNCLVETIRKRQIQLIAKAYDHIFIKEVAKTLDYSEDKVKVYLPEKYGWAIDSTNTMFIPKHEVKEEKQEMSINHVHTLIDHLIFLEDSDKLQKVERF